MRKKLFISKRIVTCYEYVELAERASTQGSISDSNRYWKRAAQLAKFLLEKHDHGVFLDEEYSFLQQISKFLEDDKDAAEYY